MRLCAGSSAHAKVCGAPHFPDAQRLRGRTVERGGRSPEGGGPAGLAGRDKTQRARSRQDSRLAGTASGRARRSGSHRRSRGCPVRLTVNAHLPRARGLQRNCPISGTTCTAAGAADSLKDCERGPASCWRSSSSRTPSATSSSAKACGRSATSAPTPL